MVSLVLFPVCLSCVWLTVVCCVSVFVVWSRFFSGACHGTLQSEDDSLPATGLLLVAMRAGSAMFFFGPTSELTLVPTALTLWMVWPTVVSRDGV